VHFDWQWHFHQSFLGPHFAVGQLHFHHLLILCASYQQVVAIFHA